MCDEKKTKTRRVRLKKNKTVSEKKDWSIIVADAGRATVAFRRRFFFLFYSRTSAEEKENSGPIPSKAIVFIDHIVVELFAVAHVVVGTDVFDSSSGVHDQSPSARVNNCVCVPSRLDTLRPC